MRAGDALETMAALPVRPLAAMLQAGPPLVLAPHPDDESLGCGGTIAACVAAGAPPFVVIATDGAGSHPGSIAFPPERLCRLRAEEAVAAVAELGLAPDRIAILGLPDTACPSQGPVFEAAAARLADIVREHGLGSIVSTWRHDPHCDHLAAHHLAARAAALARCAHLAYPVWGLTLPPDAELDGKLPTGFRIDIAQHLPTKRRAIAAHRSQYAGVVDDDPDGFQLQRDFLARFDGHYETFLDPA